MNETRQQCHASACVLGPYGILILGPSGAGKSSLSLELIQLGAILIADDQVILKKEQDKILLSPPDLLKGILELYGIGIIKTHYQSNIPLTHIIKLIPDFQTERLPEPLQVYLLGTNFPLIEMNPKLHSAALKLKTFLVSDNILKDS